MTYKILFRRGASNLIPTLDIGEPGWETDTLCMTVGDGTGTPPQIATTKTSQNMDYSLVPQFKFNTIKVIAGTKGAPSILFPDSNGNNDTGFFSPASQQVGLSVGGTQVFLGTASGLSVTQQFTQNYTGAEVLPSGPTSSRPSTPQAAMFRYNTTLNSGIGGLEYYDGSNTWEAIPSSASLTSSVSTNNAAIAALEALVASDIAGITAASLGFSANYNFNNGYVNLFGFILNWGTYSLSAAVSSSENVTFGQAFPNSAIAAWTGVTNSASNQIGVFNLTNTGMQITKGASDTFARTGFWFCLGN